MINIKEYQGLGNGTYDKGHISEEFMPKYKKFFGQVFEMFDCDTQEKTAIEIGAGYGKFTGMFNSFFKKYNVVEPDKTLAEKFKIAYPDIKLVQKGCKDIEVTGKLSFVIFTNSFQFTDKDTCIKKVNEMLKPGGFLLCTFPNPLFSGKKRWMAQITNTILYLTKLDEFQTLYVGTLFKMYVVLLKNKVDN